MHIHILQHVDFENEGIIAEWANLNNAQITRTCFFKDEKPAPLNNIDLLVVMGGPMSIYDDNDHPYLTFEKLYIREAISKGVKTLGICLGAQFLADALGQKVYRNREKEIGWFPISIGDVRHPLFDEFYKLIELPVFHWHGDTFDLPENCNHLFSTSATKNQAFIYKNQVIGLQFHIEFTENGISNMTEACKHELISKPFIQSADQITQGAKDNLTHCKQMLFSLLTNWLKS